MDIIQAIKESNVRHLQWIFTNISGQLKGVETSINLAEKVLADGLGIDGSSVGMVDTEASDLRILPDPTTFKKVPWTPNVGRIICNVAYSDGSEFASDPRTILQRVEKKLADQQLIGKVRPELEFYITDETAVSADTAEYMDIDPLDEYASLRRLMVDYMFDLGVEPKTYHHECGPGQWEIEFDFNTPLATADNYQLVKNMVRQIALFEEGLEVTYMPKPYADQAGNGLHIHQYIADSQGQSIFGNQDSGLTSEANHYVGGLLSHAYDITALTNPIVNSYKRLVPNHEAPVYCSWGIANRTALVRVPGYEQNIRCEYRAGDTSANIYLLLALLIESGLDGIKNKIEPIEGTSLNVDHLTDEQRREMKIRKLPGSLEEAINAANESSFLRGVLGDAFIDQFVSFKRKEWNRYITTSDHEVSVVTAWELENYLRKV